MNQWDFELNTRREIPHSKHVVFYEQEEVNSIHVGW